MKLLDGHIEITPGVCGGKPRIAGHSIKVQHVAMWHLRDGLSADAIADQHGLRLADVYAALAYYFDHREEIDRQITEDERFIEQYARENPQVLEFRRRREARASSNDEVSPG